MGFSEDLVNIKKAGYTSSPNSTAQQILNVINQVPAQVRAQQEQQMKDQEDQAKLFMTLREAGYTPEDATDRVNRSYRSTKFVQDLMTGKGGNAFQPPTQEDKVSLEQRKTKAEITKIGSETEKNTAQVGRMKQLTDTLQAPSGNKQAEQIRKTLDSYIKRTYPEVSGGYGTDEQKAAMASDEYVKKLEDALNRNLQLPEDKTPDAGGDTAQTGTVRVKRLSDGKIGSIPAKNFNPKKYQKI